MFSIGQRVLVIVPRIVADDGAGDLDNTDSTSRDFVFATFGDEGRVVAVEEHDGRRTAVYLVRFARTSATAYVDPSQIRAWEEIKDRQGVTEYWLLVCGSNAVQVLPDEKGWYLVSICPNEDHSASKEVEHHTGVEGNRCYWQDVEEAKRHAEMIALGEAHTSESSREEANRAHQANTDAEQEIARLFQLEKQKNAELLARLDKLEREQSERLSGMEKQMTELVALLTKSRPSA